LIPKRIRVSPSIPKNPPKPPRKNPTTPTATNVQPGILA
jgi:hypothetical protein